MYLFKGIWKTQGQTETGCSIFDIIGPVELFSTFCLNSKIHGHLDEEKNASWKDVKIIKLHMQGEQETSDLPQKSLLTFPARRQCPEIVKCINSLSSVLAMRI